MLAKTQDLLAALSRVAPAVGREGAIAHVLMHATGGTLHLRAGDLTVDVRVSLGVAGDDLAPVCVLPRDLAAALKGCKAPEVEIIGGHGPTLSLRAGRSSYALTYLPGDEYPTDADRVTKAPVDIDAAALARALGAVEHAVSADEGRPNLTGVHFGAGRVVATDGHRLAVADLPGLSADAIVPGAAVAQIRRALPTSGTVCLAIDSRHAQVTIGDYTLTARLIDGAFPRIDSVIPAPVDTTLDLSRAEAVDRTRAALAFAPAKSRTVHVQRLRDDTAAISAQDADRGSAHVEIAAAGDWRGNVSLNGDYLLDALAAATGDTVRIEIREALAPICIRQDGVVLVVMPVRS